VEITMPNYSKMSANDLARARVHAIEFGLVGDVAEIDLVLRERERLRKDAPLPFPSQIYSDNLEYTLTPDDVEYDDTVGFITPDISRSDAPVVLVLAMPDGNSITLRFDRANAAALAAILAAGACGIMLPAPT
jgi:hypothetical protein